ncbi:GMC family oxidoreductase [Sporosarcina sp. P37]|uniref:GMC family oxidoreductase n=1 Tax=unclassified Sporosarcina TaxID=2647733 RepID=UPI000A17AFBA|nr:MULTISPECIES: GMC family oxidoreductase [unclassified Sporosarcina]ARK24055.1 GMC family oxidoreductase [Sporosarcina sp. P37]PID18554.1 GMC family oxidoreductase [Sporosarcina sp. P35]
MVKKLEKVDAVIVGSGWVGGIAAAELTKAGYNVVVLERGKNKKHEDFIGTKDELRYSKRYDLMQELNKDTITSRNSMSKEAMPVRNNMNARLGNHTGGAGVHWNGMAFRWLPYDFEIYSKTVERYGKEKIPKESTMQDWGITYDELEPYYDKYEKTAAISGEENPIGPPRSDKYPNPPMKETPNIRLFMDATKALGYHPYRIPSANASQTYTNPDGETINGCVYCAFCEEYGCDFGAKGDPIGTVLATARKTGKMEIRNDAFVSRVSHDGKKANGLVYTDTTTGEEFEQPADLVVLAGFVFTNTKLLLTSKIGKPYDPVTGQGIIGKNFTGHFNNLSTYIGARGFFDNKKFNNFMGTGGLGATIDDFSGDNEDHTNLDFLHGYEVHYSQLGTRPIAHNSVPEGTPGWGKEFKKQSLKYFNRNLFITAQSGFLPNKESYMDLDPTYKDALGNPLLRVTVTYAKQDIARAKAGVARCEEIMKEMGADKINVDVVKDDIVFDHKFYTDHFFGGAIMGASPENSAVNTYSQMWDMENLFVVGGSSFPHNSNYNPTVTIGAFAYRAAEGMIKYLKEGGNVAAKALEKNA